MKQLPIRIPPLRDRPEDIEPYTYSLLASENWTGGIEPAAIALLTQQPWPGNVRALQSVLTTSVATTILRGGDTITRAIGQTTLDNWQPEWDLKAKAIETVRARRQPTAPAASAPRRRHRKPPPTREQIEQALTEAAGNQSAAADLLGTSEPTLRRYMKKLDISRDDFLRH